MGEDKDIPPAYSDEKTAYSDEKTLLFMGEGHIPPKEFMREDQHRYSPGTFLPKKNFRKKTDEKTIAKQGCK